MFVVISTIVPIGCYYYYIRDWIKKEHVVSYRYEMNNLKEVNIKNLTCYYFIDIIKIEDFYFDNILLDKNHKNVLFMTFHTKLSFVRNQYVLCPIKQMDLLEFLMELDVQYYLEMKNMITFITGLDIL